MALDTRTPKGYRKAWNGEHRPQPARSFEWVVANVYTLARRELIRLRKEPDTNSRTVERWEHVIRMCEEAGVKQNGILRHAVPTEITGG